MPIEKSTAADSQNGTYYALAIGINSYRPPLATLRTAVNDAESVAQLLSERYGFRVQTLLNANATRANILRAFAQYQSSLADSDNLLIYYAGHGMQEAEESYWLPVDVDNFSRANWISADDITHSLKLLKARHVLIISDSCYSGGLNRESSLDPGRGDDQVLLRRMRAAKSRSLMASGGNEPVTDAGSGGHSVFANAVIAALQNETAEAFTGRDLFDGFVQRRVAGAAKQTPQYGSIRGSGDESGDFVFVRPGARLNLAGVEYPSSNSAENVPSPAFGAGRPAGLKTKVNPKDGMSYVWIPPGTFKMGCLRAGPECGITDGTLHGVTLTSGFWLSQTEVTQAAYEHVVGDTPSHFVGANLPVETVSWAEADAYCRKVGGRLPTEAEWEYAARGGSTETRYGFVNRVGWFDNNAEKRTHDVGQKEPNSWGLYDMLGNVWEWTADFYTVLSEDPVTDPFISKPRSDFLAQRVIRGGSWLNNRSALRASQRNEFRPNSRSSSIGFRCVSN